MDSYNNRQYSRYSCQATIMIYPSNDPGDYHYGVSYNYSNGGMYIKTDGYLDPDQYYVIKMLNYDDKIDGPEKYGEYYGSIKWVNGADEYKDYDSEYYCGYGVEYVEPVSY